jgi:hypothetical protein
MILVGAEDVKIFEAHHSAQHSFPLSPHIEILFAPTIRIERL